MRFLVTGGYVFPADHTTVPIHSPGAYDPVFRLDQSTFEGTGLARRVWAYSTGHGATEPA